MSREGDDRQDIPFLHGFSNAVGIVPPVGEQHAGHWQVVGHHQIEAEVVGGLAGRDLAAHGQPCGADEKVDLGRDVEDGPENSPVGCFPIERS